MNGIIMRMERISQPLQITSWSIRPADRLITLWWNGSLARSLRARNIEAPDSTWRFVITSLTTLDVAVLSARSRLHHTRYAMRSSRCHHFELRLFANADAPWTIFRPVTAALPLRTGTAPQIRSVSLPWGSLHRKIPHYNLAA